MRTIILSTQTYLSEIKSLGEVQFITNGFVILPNSSSLKVIIERQSTIKDEVDVQWKLINDDGLPLGLNGTIHFDFGEMVKLDIIDLQNFTQTQTMKIELLKPPYGYYLVGNKVANIKYVCKCLFLKKLITYIYLFESTFF